MQGKRALLVAAVAVATVGCLQGERKIHVEADGSGRIEDSVKVVGEFAEMMAAFDDAEGEKTAEQKLAEKKEQAQKAGEKMGPGVTLVSYEVGDDGTEKTVYAFEDISELEIADTPMPSSDDEEGGGPPAPTAGYTFRHETSGGATTLVVVNSEEPEPEGGGAAAGEEPSAEEKAQMIGMFKGMFEGARIRTFLSLGGEIVETDSPHRAGSEITLLEIDFAELLADDASVEAMATSDDRPDRATLSKIKGITIFAEPELTVRFK